MNLRTFFKTAILMTAILMASALPATARQYRVIGVDDGDTIRVSGHGKTFWVRLAGIDAPEKPRNNLSPGQPFYYEAKQFVVNMILYKAVNLKDYGPDANGNMLGVVLFHGKNMNLELVKVGFAEVYRGKLPEGFDAAPYRAAESTARNIKKGIWSLGDQYISPLEWRKNQNKK